MRLIDASKLLKDLRKEYRKYDGNISEYELYVGEGIEKSMEVVKAQPTVKARPKGKWIGIEYDGYANGNPVYDVYECSICKEEHYGEFDTLTNFCPECGAEMR